MNTEIEKIKNTRRFLLEVIKDLSIEQVNEIPSAFNNNIVWNLGHLVAAQQGVCYVRAALKPRVEEKYLAPFRPGTKPTEFVDQNELSIIKDILFSSLDQFVADYQDKLFSNYGAWSTRYGVDLANIDEAIRFLAFHEGLHTGVIMSQKKLISK